MRDRERLLATVAIWFAFMVLMGIILGSPVSAITTMQEPFGFATILTLAGAVAISTYSIWQGAGRSSTTRAEQPSEKAKRDNAARIARLIEQMDEDEIIELETLLVSRDVDDYRQQ